MVRQSAYTYCARVFVGERSEKSEEDMHGHTRVHRWCIGAGAVIALGLLGAASASADSGSGIPAAAISRSLQAVPAQNQLTLPPYLDTTGETVAPFPGAPSYPSQDTYSASQDRGIPLGGIGTGSFEINQAGSFGPWYFGGGQEEWRTLPQAALHVEEQPAGGATTVRTLAVNGSAPQGNSCLGGLCPPFSTVAWTPGVLSGFPTLSSGQASYKALYPFGWISTNPKTQGGPFDASISTRFWSPIVAGDDKSSSMPVAYFDVRVANNTARRDTVSVMFTFPNAPAHVPNVGAYNWIGGGRNVTGYVGTQLSTRTGLKSQYDYSPQLHAGGVTMSSNSTQDTPDEQSSDWTIAATPQPGQQESYVTSWNANGDGSDIIDAFKNGNGVLPDGTLDNTNSAGAVAVRVDLAPGQSTTIPFVLAWDFPQDVYSANPGQSPDYTVWMRRYTQWFGAKTDAQNNYVAGSYPFHQGWNIAQWAMANHDTNLDGVLRWWQPIANNARVPLPIRTSALNQLYYLTAGNSMWTNGLVSNDVPATDGQRLGTQIPGQHLFAQQTGNDGGDSRFGGQDVTANAFEAYDRLFPGLERDYLLQLTEMMNLGGPSVGTFGNGQASPFVQWSSSDGHTIGADWSYIYRVWRYYEVTHDVSLLRYAYPDMLALYQTDQTAFGVTGSEGALPLGGERLANDARTSAGETTHDLLVVSGYGIEPAGLWLTEIDAMRAATAEAMRLGISQATPTVYSELSTRFDATKASMNSALWNAGQQHYNFDTGDGNVDRGDYDQGLFADATYPADITHLAGLPSIFDTTKLVDDLQQTYNHNIAPFSAHGHPIGALDLLSADYGVIGDAHPVFLDSDLSAREMWVGFEYPLAATMITTGERTGNRRLINEGVTLADGVANETWNTPSDGYAFQTPESQGMVLDAPGTVDGNTPVPASTTTTAPQLHRNLSYQRALDVWDLYDTLAPIPDSNRTGP
jgi:non-lysosomal glucosylceramidase